MRVIIEYITLGLDYIFSSFGLGYNFSSCCYNLFSADFSDPFSLEGLLHYIAPFR